MTEDLARQEICRVGRSLFERGYVHATAGNISVRLPKESGGGYLITPTDACVGFLEPHRLARINEDGLQVSGDRASKTIVLHRKIYECSQPTTSPASCVIHAHSTHCVALTLLPQHVEGSAEAELLPALTPYFVMKVGRVPLIPYAKPGDAGTAQRVGEAITRYSDAGAAIRAVMLDRLGPNVWHDSPSAAMATLEELEETARLWMLCDRRSGPLQAEAIDELRSTFSARW
ncbi:aldolase [Variovorax humicola]|uniref:Aldolase n=1 Tax=Variovorax humicola TaxID=1769758 RepID=A0ABU8VXZ7_9BURK